MIFEDQLVVIRGGGDLASGVAYRLRTAGFPVVVLELAAPAAVRRTVAFASAVTEGRVEIEGIAGVLTTYPREAVGAARRGAVAVLVSPEMVPFPEPITVVVDARMLKRNPDTTRRQAPLVIALGPGYAAGTDCHAVVETKRGHRLGRVIWEGSAAADTGRPGRLGSVDADRVLRAPVAGPVAWQVAIGDEVRAGQRLGRVGNAAIDATISGVVRGLIQPGYPAEAGTKIGDIDPRGDAAACFEISDKARLVGGGVLEAVFTRLNQQVM